MLDLPAALPKSVTRGLARAKAEVGALVVLHNLLAVSAGLFAAPATTRQ